MIRSFPLTFEGLNFSSHRIFGFCELRDKIALIHFAFGSQSREEYDNDKCTTSYALLDVFSEDFAKRSQAYLEYREKEIFTATDAACYWDNERLLLNTKHYKGFGDSIAKVMEIRDTELIEVGNAPTPISQVYNDSKTYTFGDYIIRMASQFVMECRSQSSGETIWKLKLSAYLYTEVEERDGILYFGTSGKGGRFYGVQLANGNVIFNYDTGGTERYAWYKESVLLSDRKRKPVLLNPKDGSEVRRIDIGKFKMHLYQYLHVKNDRLYVVASGSDCMHAVCVEIGQG